MFRGLRCGTTPIWVVRLQRVNVNLDIFILMVQRCFKHKPLMTGDFGIELST